MSKIVFDRVGLLVCGCYRMSRQIVGQHNQRGWAKYPEGFFGRWVPDSSNARRSMNRPKPVVFVEGVGWKFSIELSSEKCCLVGCVFASDKGDDLISGNLLPGTIGYLATTSSKRVRVKFL